MGLVCVEIGINAPKTVTIQSFCLLGNVAFWEVDPAHVNDNDIIKLDYSQLPTQNFFYDVSFGDTLVGCDVSDMISRSIIACVQDGEQWIL